MYSTALEQVSSGSERVVKRRLVVSEILRFLREDQIDRAARLYRQCQDDLGYSLMNVVNTGNLAPALARLFLAARNFYKAGQVFESLNRVPEAAACYEKAEVFLPAAEMYGRLENFSKAAEMLERGGSYRQAADFFVRVARWGDAARCFLRTNERLLAGEALLKGGLKKEALEVLQKIKSGHRDYAKAVALSGPLLAELGFLEVALHRYEEICATAPVNAETVGVFYELGAGYEIQAQNEKAKVTYEKILQWDVAYRDVQERYLRLRDGVSESPGEAPRESVTESKASISKPARAPRREFLLQPHYDAAADHVLFASMSHQDVRKVLAFGEHRSASEATVLCEQDKEEPGLFLLLEGEADVQKTSAGDVACLRRLGPGTFFGELALCGPQIARTTILAATPVSYYFFGRENLETFIRTKPCLANKLLVNLLRAVETTSEPHGCKA